MTDIRKDQLWQFLLNLLCSREHRGIIEWLSPERQEFVLIDREAVAKEWGKLKNKPLMNYEKMSRALRNYYESDKISKVEAHRFAYKFEVNLEQLTGYSAQELSDEQNRN